MIYRSLARPAWGAFGDVSGRTRRRFDQGACTASVPRFS